MKFNKNEGRSKQFSSMSTIAEGGGFAFVKLMKNGVIGGTPIDKDALDLLADAYGGKYVEVDPFFFPSSGMPLEIDGSNYGKGSF